MRGSIDRAGKKSWRIRFDLGPDPTTGKRRVQSIRVHGRRRDADAKLAEMIGATNSGSFVAPTKMIVADFLRERLEQWRAAGDISAKSYERYQQLIEGNIIPHIGTKTVQGLRTLDIERFHTKLLASGRADGKGGLSARTVKHCHRVLAKALGDGVRHGQIARNVCGRDGQRAPKVEGSEIEIITAEEIDGALAKLRGRAIYPKAVIALFTGLRRGELVALRWSNVDLAGKLIRVRETVEETKAHGLRVKPAKTKAGRRDITLPDIVVDTLTEHRRAQLERRMAMGLGKLPHDALLFPALDSGLQSPRQLSGDWREAVKLLKLPDVSLHALRHTHASMLIDAGIDVVKISKRLGHASPHITLMVYAHLFRSRDTVSADAINAALASVGRTS